MSAVLRFGRYPLYSLDASAFIEFKPLRRDVFKRMWGLLGDLADQGRLVICREAADECLDAEPKQFLREHPLMVVTFEYTGPYVLRLQAEAPRHRIQLVNPSLAKNKADPFVVALALALDGRDPHDLRRTLDPEAECLVVSQEHRKGPGAKWVQIPNVCDFYGLGCIGWQDFVKREGYQG